MAPSQLPAWIRARAARQGLTLDDDAVAALAAQTEGNLLAAMQEIQKLSLPGLPGRRRGGARERHAEQPLSTWRSSARRMLQQDRARALRILAGLRAEGVEPTLILWSIVQELRMLWLALVPGAPVAGVWSRNKRGAGARRLPVFRQRGRAGFARLTERAARADRIIKGQTGGNAWDEIALLVVEFASGEALLAAA